LDPHGAQLRFSFDDGDERVAALLDRPPLFVRNPRARRYVLRLLADGTPRVTIPRGGSKREAERFLVSQQTWLSRQRASLVDRLARRPPQQWTDGHAVLLRGSSHVLHRATAALRAAVSVQDRTLVVTTPGDGDLRPTPSATPSSSTS
jgi:predicted metal-dependent hydrolase